MNLAYFVYRDNLYSTERNGVSSVVHSWDVHNNEDSKMSDASKCKQRYNAQKGEVPLVMFGESIELEIENFAILNVLPLNVSLENLG